MEEMPDTEGTIETGTAKVPATGSEAYDGARGPAMGRRGFVVGAGGAAALLALGAVKFLPDAAVCRPPGAQDEEDFLGACVRCGKCIEACPNGVIVPTHIEDGLAAMRTPKLNFSRTQMQLTGKAGWCDHCENENGGVARCVAVCPSGALDSAQDSSFDTMILGKAEIDRETCLAWRLKGCTVCKNACPTEAIVFDDNNRPSVVDNKCNGCGACEQSCVSLESTSVGEGETSREITRRAITVQPVEA